MFGRGLLYMLLKEEVRHHWCSLLSFTLFLLVLESFITPISIVGDVIQTLGTTNALLELVPLLEHLNCASLGGYGL